MLRCSALRTCQDGLIFFAFLGGEGKLVKKYFHSCYSTSGHDLFDLQSTLRHKYAVINVELSCFLKWKGVRRIVSFLKGRRGHHLQNIRVGWKGYNHLKVCCNATLFSTLEAVCHFQTRPLSCYLDPYIT